ncbi:FolC bifunctional protein [Thermovibrio ammonificans HB-1]|uniref:FolC bifunctional protein n=1 Tax=Thermovibrio ammonificans (strain DSM 15698 / JCM 12110 / HB-1) TaxID=648996 RepID=E8T4N3_THEA1|nr:Mur ligase family protein [Thermovibrio ammonificans]ADU97491.1 FolC bifunctional protein [Thermovibrio ammonificans HB-1]
MVLKFEEFFANKEFIWKPGLERVRAAVEEFGGKDYPSVIVAGTNGKGSTALATAESLAWNGLKCGLFTSPHVYKFSERIRIGPREVSEQLLNEAFDSVRPLIEKFSLTYFEASLLLALEVFRRERVDCAVFEVGLGGRLDATNVLEHQVGVVTPVGFDHRDYLGDSLEAIAVEKAAVLKPGMVAVVANQQRPVLDVLKRRPVSELHLYGKHFWADGVKVEFDGTEFFYMATVPVKTSSVGFHQAVNVSVALRAAQQLSERFLGKRFIFPKELKSKLPGRFEVLRKEPLAVFDGAHNKQALDALFKLLRQLGLRGSVVYSGFRDKEQGRNLEAVARYLRWSGGSLYLFQLPFDRAVSVEELVSEARLLGIDRVSVLDSISLKELNFPVVITGSFYLGGFIER